MPDEFDELLDGGDDVVPSVPKEAEHVDPRPGQGVPVGGLQEFITTNVVNPMPETEFDGWIDPQAQPPAHVSAVDEEAFSPESAEQRQLRLQEEQQAMLAMLDEGLSQQEVRNKYGYSTGESRTMAQRKNAAGKMVARSRKSLEQAGTSEEEIQALWRRQAELMEHERKSDTKHPAKEK